MDWAQTTNLFKALLISPLVGFVFAALLLILFKTFVKDQRLYEAREGDSPPPFWIRFLLIYLHRRQLSRTDRMTGRKAWASSC